MRRAFGPEIIGTQSEHWEVVMTSNGVTALGRPRRGGARRGMRFLTAALSLCLAMLALSAMPVLAAESSATTTSSTTTSNTEAGYSTKPEPPAEKKVAPAKEKVEAKKEVAPAKEVVTPVAKALPFTGLDLRWVVGGGLLMLLIGGVSLRVIARRERHGIGR